MLYPNLAGFIKDVKTMFKNCYKYNGPKHKLSQNCEIIEKRFDKLIAKLKAERKIEDDN
jgi:hypothetical protein